MGTRLNDYKMDALSARSREMLREVFDKVKPDIMFHGHYHHWHSTRVDGCHVIGLGCDGDFSALAELEIPSMKVK